MYINTYNIHTCILIHTCIAHDVHAIQSVFAYFIHRPNLSYISYISYYTYSGYSKDKDAQESESGISTVTSKAKDRTKPKKIRVPAHVLNLHTLLAGYILRSNNENTTNNNSTSNSSATISSAYIHNIQTFATITDKLTLKVYMVSTHMLYPALAFLATSVGVVVLNMCPSQVIYNIIMNMMYICCVY